MTEKILLCLMALLHLPAFAQLTIEKDSSVQSVPVQLSEVIVTSRVKNLQSKGLGNFRINPQQVKISPLFLGERDIIKTLQFLPGVSAGMEGSSQLNIRGGTNDQTLYLLDDVPVYNQNHTFGLFSVFNTDAISGVELYKGGIPAPYGDKLSGVVSVSLNEGDGRKHNTSVSLGLLAGTLASDGYLIKDRLTYNVAARRSFLDLLYGGVMLLSGEESGGGGMISFYDVNSKLSWKINHKNNLSWQIYSGLDDIYGSNKMTEGASDTKYSEKTGYGWKTFMTSLRYYSQLTSNLLFSGNVYYTTLDNFNYYKSKTKTPESKQSESAENGESSLLTEIGGKVAFEHNVSVNNHVFYGLEGAYQEYMPAYTYKKTNRQTVEYNTDRLELTKLSGYIHNEWSVNPWLLNVGIRASLYNNMKNAQFTVEPRVKINYFREGGRNKFMLAYDYMHQPVHTVNELNYNVQTDFWIPYRENKLPNSSQISLGWKNYTTRDLSITIEAYYKKMSNLLLIRDLEYYIDFHTGFETGSGRSMGIEFMAEYLKDRITVRTSYTLSNSRRTFGDDTYPFKYDAPHSLSAFGNYTLIRKDKKEHAASVNIQYKTGYPYYIPDISYPSPGLPTQTAGYEDLKDIFSAEYIPDKPNTRLRDYLRIDLNYTVDKKLRRGNLVWQFSLLNATNRNNPYSVYKKDGKYKAFVLIPFLPSISIKRSF